jgi:hypothetical protein
MFSRRRWLLPALVPFFVAAGYMLGPGAGPAMPRTLACPSEVGIFWKMTTGGSATYGAYNTFPVSNVTLDGCLTGDLAGSGHTSRVLWNGLDGYYFETGYKEYWCTAGHTSHCWRAFAEESIAGSGTQWNGSSGYPCITLGSSETWEATNEINPTFWDATVVCNGNVSYLLWNFNSGNYSSGNAEGEGFRHGASSALVGTHSNLIWTDTNYVNHSASGVTCRKDTDGLYNGRFLSNTSFDFVTSGGTSC